MSVTFSEEITSIEFELEGNFSTEKEYLFALADFTEDRRIAFRRGVFDWHANLRSASYERYKNGWAFPVFLDLETDWYDETIANTAQNITDWQNDHRRRSHTDKFKKKLTKRSGNCKCNTGTAKERCRAVFPRSSWNGRRCLRGARNARTIRVFGSGTRKLWTGTLDKSIRTLRPQSRWNRRWRRRQSSLQRPLSFP